MHSTEYTSQAFHMFNAFPQVCMIMIRNLQMNDYDFQAIMYSIFAHIIDCIVVMKTNIYIWQNWQYNGTITRYIQPIHYCPRNIFV